MTAIVLGALTFTIATIGINIVANFISPAFDFSNVSPQKISWRMGGMIAAVGSVLLTPWNLYSNPEVIHYTLETLGAFIGPLFGVLLADFYLVRKQKIVVDDLFTMSKTANYWYKGGYNPAAVVATLIGAILAMAPVLLGGVVFGMAGAAQYSWFIGCGVAFALYYVLATRGPWKMSALRVAEGATLVERPIDRTQLPRPTTRRAAAVDIPQLECRAVRFFREPSHSRPSACWPSTPAAGTTCCNGSRRRWPTCGPRPRASCTGSSTSSPTDGLIEVSDIGPRGRKEYRVTDAGPRRTGPLDHQPAGRSAPAQRPTCCGSSCSARCRPTRPASYVAAFAEHADSELKRLEHLRDSLAPWGDSDADFYGRAALEYGLRIAAMEGDWARWLVTAIDERTHASH